MMRAATRFGWRDQLRPGIALREIVQQATASLIAMDANRLEELAHCCADLNRGAREYEPDAAMAEALQYAQKELKLLNQVLYETRANLAVLTQLHAMRVREMKALRASYRNGPPDTFERRGGIYGDN